MSTNTTSGSSNVFKGSAVALQDKLLGPSYPYYENIKSPSQIGMSDAGTMDALGKDINGLIQYVELLVQGKSSASKTGQPLGNKFFLNTGGKCNDVATNTQQDRYIYINNVPDGDIPFISGAMGQNFTDFRGLIPGIMSDLNVLNPFEITQAFMAGSNPDCKLIKLQTIDNNNQKSSESHYLTLIDIKNQNLKESFTSGIADNAEEIKLPNDPMTQLYFAGLSGLSIYVLYRLMNK
uniref:Uncharacterized protein n=1 Tax=viral metagenome TaxID=1070528 RepID=A0A6C0II35_9ZZZZ